MNLTSLLGAARGLDLPLGAVVEAARAAVGPTFYDLLATFDAPVGYAVAALDGGARSTLDAADRPRPGARVCAWDAEALGLQASLLVGGACGATAAETDSAGQVLEASGCAGGAGLRIAGATRVISHASRATPGNSAAPARGATALFCRAGNP